MLWGLTAWLVTHTPLRGLTQNRVLVVADRRNRATHKRDERESAAGAQSSLGTTQGQSVTADPHTAGFATPAVVNEREYSTRQYQRERCFAVYEKRITSPHKEPGCGETTSPRNTASFEV